MECAIPVMSAIIIGFSSSLIIGGLIEVHFIKKSRANYDASLEVLEQSKAMLACDEQILKAALKARGITEKEAVTH